ncbi:MAG TPA: SRPBCC family protein [Solirubrobacteraceae bacterium]|jgi:uncharacterized membrane protein|nr:SRPBCC family protein [Solirubrobacteraceae bacterium]
MARTKGTRQVDPEAVQRESPVRQAHAAEARRHGRASAPGYLGVPLEEAPDVDREETEDDGEGGQTDSRRSRPRTRGDSGTRRKPRTSGRGSEQGGGRRAAATRQKRGKQSEKREDKEAEESRSPGKRAKAAQQTRTSKQPRGSKAAQKPTPKAGASKKAAGSGPKASGGRSGSKAAAKAKPRRATAAAKAKPRRAATAAKSGASKVASKVASAAEDGKGAVGKQARHAAGGLAKKALLFGARKAAKTASRAARRAGEAGAQLVAERARRLPIQRSIDVAVPVEVAWQQWLEFDHLPEGANRLTSVERDGDTLCGRLEGVAHGEWEAEVLDEREHESFAWRSTEGSDSAGLVTFHELGERLTRIELELDIKPVHLIEAATLATHIADRRVEAELRSFKAEAELLSPDIYEELLSSNGSNGSDQEASEEDSEQEDGEQ